MKTILVLFLAVGLVGCSTLNDLQLEQYNHQLEAAIQDGSALSFKLSGDVNSVKGEIMEVLSEFGYGDIFSSNKEIHLYVHAKQADFIEAVMLGAAHAYRIIVKYTPLKDGQVQVDILRGAQMAVISTEVDKDIQKIRKALETKYGMEI